MRSPSIIEQGQGFDKTVGDQLLGKLQTSGKVLTPSTFADVWIEAEKKMLDKIAASQSNLEKIKVACV